MLYFDHLSPFDPGSNGYGQIGSSVAEPYDSPADITTPFQLLQVPSL